MKGIITLLLTLCLTTASARIELNEIDRGAARVQQIGLAVMISGAQGETVRIYDIVGKPVATYVVDSPEKRIDISRMTRGVYLLKVANVTKKIQINN